MRPSINTLINTLVLVMTFLCVSGAHALGLGEIEVSSRLNEPFAATITLHGASDASPEQLLVRLASEEDFNRMGVSREFFLTGLRFEIEMKEPVRIVISSEQPIREPFLNFILDVQSPNAQLLKEYTVFLDPKL